MAKIQGLDRGIKVSFKNKIHKSSDPTWSGNGIISPRNLGYLYLIYAIVAFVFPSSVYESIIAEPYYAGGDVKLLLFAFFCVLLYQAGISFAGIISKQATPGLNVNYFQGSRRITLLLLSVIVIALNVYSALMIFSQNKSEILALLAQNPGVTSRIKQDFISDGALLAANPLLIVMSWALYSEKLSGNRSKSLLLLLAISIIGSILISAMKLARYEVMPLLMGLAATRIGHEYRINGRFDIKAIKVSIAYAFVLFSIFISISFLRASSDDPSASAFATLPGYTITSFNRLSAVLDGRLMFIFSGSGTYVLNFWSNLPLFGSTFADFLPSSEDVFRSEFVDIANVGLYPGYNWLTMYGYYFIDLGWWVLAYIFAFGVISHFVWRNFVTGGFIGAALYPYLASSLVLSFSSYWISRPFIVSILILWATYIACHFLVNSILGNYQKARLNNRPNKGA